MTLDSDEQNLARRDDAASHSLDAASHSLDDDHSAPHHRENSALLKSLDAGAMFKTLDTSAVFRTLDASAMFKFPDYSAMFKALDTSAMFRTLDASAMFKTLDTSAMFRTLDASAMFRFPDYSAMFKTLDTSAILRLPPFVLDFDSEPLIRALKLRRVPENWLDVDVDADDAQDAIHSVLDDGIPLGWVPSGRAVQLLLDASDARARRRVISNNYRGILADCERVCATLPAPRALFLADKIRRSIAALRGGHGEAAQALATNVLDTLVEQHSRGALGVGSGALTNPSYQVNLSRKGWRLALSLRPLATVMSGKYGLDHREPGFRRNATTHAVTRHQYNRINSVIAIMLATSVLACFVRDTSAFD